MRELVYIYTLKIWSCIWRHRMVRLEDWEREKGKQAKKKKGNCLCVAVMVVKKINNTNNSNNKWKEMVIFNICHNEKFLIYSWGVFFYLSCLILDLPGKCAGIFFSFAFVSCLTNKKPTWCLKIKEKWYFWSFFET